MKPSKPDNHPDLFRSQLSQILNLSHPLCRLSEQINWQRIEEQIDTLYAFGPGQPPIPTRLLVGLHYLKYSFDESDESVVERWVENPYWQYFCGYEYLQHELPLHPTSLVKWRHRMGDKLEVLLAETVKVAMEAEGHRFKSCRARQFFNDLQHSWSYRKNQCDQNVTNLLINRPPL